jgi:hypothetical protein
LVFRQLARGLTHLTFTPILIAILTSPGNCGQDRRHFVDRRNAPDPA